MKKVSIIVPVYNAEKTIERCLIALMNQTYKNIEVISVNDGSKDRSFEILEKYAQKDARIKVFSQENSGPAKTRHVAMAQATGEYIMFCDADDWYDVSMVEEMVKAIEDNEVDIAMCDCEVIDLSNGALQRNDVTNNYFKLAVSGKHECTIDFIDSINVVLWNKIFRKKIIENNKIEYPTRFEHDDTMFFLKYVFHCQTYFGLNKELYHYVAGNEQSIMGKLYTKKNKGREFDFIFCYQDLIDYVRSSELQSDYLKYVSVRFYNMYRGLYNLLDDEKKKEAKELFQKFVRTNNELIVDDKIKRLSNIKAFKVFEDVLMHNKRKRVSPLEFIFSIRNEEDKKVLRILGIKLKFRNKNKIIQRKIEQLESLTHVNSAKIDKNSDALHVEIEEAKNTLKNTLSWMQKNNSRNYYKSDFERAYCRRFYDNIKNRDYYLDYKKLIQGLDNNSIFEVNKIIARITKSIQNEQAVPIDIFSEREKQAIEKLNKEFWGNILKLSDNCFAYQKYFLPIHHFEPSVFYYRHNIDNLKHKEYFSNRDIIDVGGFIGDSAIILSEYTNKNVHSFEPVSKNYELMLKTIELNECKNIIPHNFGLGDTHSEEVIHVDYSCSSIVLANKKELETENIKITTLDEFVEKNNLDVGLIKVDVEGYEQQFLKGAINTIKKHKPTLLLSIYHNADDFFNIKPFVENLHLDYAFQIVHPIDGKIHLETLLIAEPTFKEE